MGHQGHRRDGKLRHIEPGTDWVGARISGEATSWFATVTNCFEGAMRVRLWASHGVAKQCVGVTCRAPKCTMKHYAAKLEYRTVPNSPLCCFYDFIPRLHGERPAPLRPQVRPSTLEAVATI